MRRCTGLLCGVLVPGLLAGWMSVAAGEEGTCKVVRVGLDVSQAGNSAPAFLGHCPGQTFVTRDTLLRSLSVWRVASQYYSDIGMHLYITETDSTGFPLHTHVLHEGPTLVLHGDGVTPTQFRWDFDPPAALPRPGMYAFFVCQDPCFAYFDVLTTAEDAGLYPDGIVWCTERSSTCSMYGTWPDAFPRGDLIFQVEFCRPGTTPVLPATWGRLKTLYR